MSALACPEAYAHDPHFWMSLIAGGPEGSIPTLTFICPGRDA